MSLTIRRPFAVALFSATALAPLGCQDYLFEQKCPESITESEFTRPATTPTPADILFVVDNSGSMADEQENLARNFDSFINEIAGAGDYHIAVVSTDQTNDKEEQGLSTTLFSADFPNNYLELNRSGCVKTDIDRGCFRGPDPARRLIRSGDLTRAEQISAFQGNVRVGSCGSGDEEGLEAMVSALEQTAPGRCNAGFLREEANLVVVFVSDEEEQSDEAIEAYLSRLAQLKPLEKVRVAMVVGSVDGTAARCSIGGGAACGSLCQNRPSDGTLASCDPNTPNACGFGEFCERTGGGGRCQKEVLRFWDNQNCAHCSYFDTPDCCSALAGSRYIEFARALEREVSRTRPEIQPTNCRGAEGQRVACLVDSICQESFGDTLKRIARDLVITTRYTLTPPAVNPMGVTVRVKGGRFGSEGKALAYGIDFTVNTNADGLGTELILTAADNAPRLGEEIDVVYVSDLLDNRKAPRGACGLE